MGFFSSYSGDGKQIVNVEFILKMMDKLIPPVGSIYMSTSPSNPNMIYPDTSWVEWGNGRVPVGVDTSQTEFDSVEKTGGEKTHTLTIAEMPSHKHNVYDKGHHHGSEDNSSGDSQGNYRRGISSHRGNASTATADIVESSVGSSEAHDNLQPYITCYMWKRTV
jgi:hypothetical protein